MEPNFYVYTPGFDKRLGSFELLKLAIFGMFPDYTIHKDSDLHFVHKNYKMYMIRTSLKNMPSTTHSFYSGIETMLNFERMVKEQPDALYEIAAADWQYKMLGYCWYKHFTYSKIYPSKYTKRYEYRSPKIHPMQSLLT